ncbi:hypothetical protein JCM8208_004343 [Rhodotorula glutinis]
MPPDPPSRADPPASHAPSPSTATTTTTTPTASTTAPVSHSQHTWADQAHPLPPAPDPAAQFKFGPAPRARAPAAGGGAGASGAATGGARSAFFKVPGEGVQRGAQGAGAGRARPEPPRELEDDDEGEEEEEDAIVLAQRSPTKGSSTLPPAAATTTRDLPPSLAAMRLPLATPSSARQTGPSATTAAAPATAPRSSMSGTIQAPDPGPSTTSSFSSRFGAAASTTTTSSSSAATARPPTRAHQHDPPPHFALPQHAHAHGPQQQQGPSSKKRPHTHTGEAGLHLPAQRAASSSAGKALVPGGGGGGGSRSSSTKGGDTAAAAAAAAVGGGGGTDEGHPHPELKRRKTGETKSRTKSAMLTLIDLDDKVVQKDAELAVARAELASLRDGLKRRDVELAQAVEGKRALKDQFAARIQGALESAGEAHKALEDVKDGMNESFGELKQSLGSVASASEMREELRDVKEAVSVHCLDEKNELWLERIEETKLAVLKELEAELSNRGDVIKLLRDDLEVKAGSLAEARSRVQQLESTLDDAQRASTTRETAATAREAHVLVLLEAARVDQKRHRDELDRALVGAAEREEALGAKVGEGLEREKKLRDEWVRVKEEVGRREEELRRATTRVNELEKKHADDAHALEQLSADLSTARDELNAEIQQSADRLKKAHDDLERERAEHVKRVEEVKAPLTAELVKTQSALAEAVNAREEVERKLHDQVQEVSSVRAQVERLEREKEVAVTAKSEAEDSLRTLSDSHDRLESDHAASLELVDHLQLEVTALRESESRAEATFAVREKELLEGAAKEKQQAAAAALQQGRELSQTELINKGNELKRTHNKLEELTKKHNRALNELAVAKSRPVLNAHIASSSTNGDPSPPGAHVTAAENGTRITAVATSSPLSALGSDSSPGATSTKPKKKPKAVTFVTPAARAAPTVPAKPKRRTSGTTTSSIAAAAPAKQHKAIVAPTSAKRSRAPPLFDDHADPDETLVHDGEAETMDQDDDAAAGEESLETMLVQDEGDGGGSGEGEEEEDDIVDFTTPMPPAGQKPKLRQTYASKKRR